MALDPPLTADEEDIVRRVRAIKAKRAEVAAIEAKRAAARDEHVAERANEENMRREFSKEMREQGISDPDELMRKR